MVTLILTIIHVQANELTLNTGANVNFDADYFPSKTTENYGVILLTGSSGGKGNEMAKRIVNMGYPVLSLAYFYEDIKRKVYQQHWR